MNVEEVCEVKNHLYHIDTDIRKAVEFLRDAKENISDAVDYLKVGRSDSILSGDEAMNIIENVLKKLDYTRTMLENDSDKMTKINVAIADRVKPLKFD